MEIVNAIIKALALVLGFIYSILAIGFYLFLRSEDYLKAKGARLILCLFIFVYIFMLYGYFINFIT